MSILGILWLSEFESSFSNLLLIPKLFLNSHGRLGNVSSTLSFKNGILTFATATLLELYNAMPWAGRRLHQTLVTVSPLTSTTTFSFDNRFSFLASAQAFCYQIKIIQAFSWALFIGFVLALYILFSLVGLAQRFGRYYIWTEPIRGSKFGFKLLRWRLIFFS